MLWHPFAVSPDSKNYTDFSLASQKFHDKKGKITITLENNQPSMWFNLQWLYSVGMQGNWDLISKIAGDVRVSGVIRFVLELVRLASLCS